MRLASIAAVAWLVCVSGAQAVEMQTVAVGNPGNAGENTGECVPNGHGPCRECGAVDYVYNIGKYEVTAREYAEFLNAVAAEDTYGLYNTNMWIAEYGCKIERAGSSPNYSYSVAPDWADRPVNFISWGDAARFANWLHNGQPTGVQDLSTTEGGSYYLNGATSNTELLAVVRELEATWVIPSEDEWYKAAYHCNDGVTGNYYDYPTSSDSVPSKDLAGPDSGNNATFNDSGYTIGSPYYRTEAGAHENSESPCGTFDQGGNVFEWNEAILYGSFRGLRGGSFSSTGVDLHALLRNYYYYPTDEIGYFGFRVAEVPVLDFTGDGYVDLFDFELFAGCPSGPGETTPPKACPHSDFSLADIDRDGDVDLHDFWAMQSAFNGRLCRLDGDCLEIRDFCRKAVGDCWGWGECEGTGWICLPVWVPVCGCDGHTYSSDCHAWSSGMNVLREGECQP